MNTPIEISTTKTGSKKSFAPLIAGALVAIATPGAYMIGLRYYQGHLSGFGVDSDAFPKSAPDIYLYSYDVVGLFGVALSEGTTSAFAFLSTFPGAWGTLSSFAVLVAFLAALLKKKDEASSQASDRFPRLSSFLRKLHWKNNRFVQSLGIAGLLYYFLLLILFLPIAITLIWWVIPMGAYQRGEKAANEQILAFQKDGCHPNARTKWDVCSILLNKEGKPVREGILVGINDKDVAIYAKDGVEVIGRQEGFVLRLIWH